MPLPRSFFDDTKGLTLIESVASASSKIGISSHSKGTAQYLAFGAAGALLQYATAERGVVISSSSLTVEMHGNSEQHMFLDPSAVESLELVKTMRFADRSRRSTSLFDVLNHTQTVCGARLLKTSILQPFTHINTINARLDSLQVSCATPAAAWSCPTLQARQLALGTS